MRILNKIIIAIVLISLLLLFVPLLPSTEPVLKTKYNVTIENKTVYNFRNETETYRTCEPASKSEYIFDFIKTNFVSYEYDLTIPLFYTDDDGYEIFEYEDLAKHNIINEYEIKNIIDKRLSIKTYINVFSLSSVPSYNHNSYVQAPKLGKVYLENFTLEPNQTKKIIIDFKDVQQKIYDNFKRYNGAIQQVIIIKTCSEKKQRVKRIRYAEVVPVEKNLSYHEMKNETLMFRKSIFSYIMS